MKHTILTMAVLSICAAAHATGKHDAPPPAPAPLIGIDFGGRAASTSGAESAAEAQARAASNSNANSISNAAGGAGGKAYGYGGDSRATVGDQTSSLRNSASNAQGQRQGQEQGQQASQSTSTDFSGAGGTSGVNQTFQGAQAGSGDRLLVLPNIPATPASSVPGAMIASQVTACGPRMHVDREPIDVHNEGLVSSTTKQQGWTYRLVPAADYGLETFEERGGRFYGHQAILTYAVVSTGYARQLVIGGGGSSGSWGQGGIGGSGANQQLVTNIQLIPCVLPAAAPAVERIVERVVIEPSPVMMPVVKKSAPKRRAAPPVRQCYELRNICPAQK